MFEDLELSSNKIYDRYLDKDLHKLFPQLIWEMSLSSTSAIQGVTNALASRTSIIILG